MIFQTSLLAIVMATNANANPNIDNQRVKPPVEQMDIEQASDSNNQDSIEEVTITGEGDQISITREMVPLSNEGTQDSDAEEEVLIVGEGDQIQVVRAPECLNANALFADFGSRFDEIKILSFGAEWENVTTAREEVDQWIHEALENELNEALSDEYLKEFTAQMIWALAMREQSGCDSLGEFQIIESTYDSITVNLDGESDCNKVAVKIQKNSDSNFSLTFLNKLANLSYPHETGNPDHPYIDEFIVLPSFYDENGSCQSVPHAGEAHVYHMSVVISGVVSQ